MSSTRTAKDDSVYHQSSYASSSEFERGLLGNLVAKRVALLDQHEDRELIWAVHFLSHQDGGLEAVARDLLAGYPQHIGTPAMLAIGKHGEQTYTAAELAQIARQFPKYYDNELLGAAGFDHECKISLMHKRRELSVLQELVAMEEESHDTRGKIKALETEIAEIEGKQRVKQNHSIHQSAGELQRLCIEAGQGSLNLPSVYIYPLAEVLADLCIKPSRNLDSVAPWYFSGMVEALREHVAKWSASKTNFVETSLGQIVAEEFDYTMQGRCLSLLTGESRRGKSFAAKSCCLKNIGRARFVEVPPGNDDTSFFRALARGLGLGNFLKYKTIDIRERVESVLLSGDLVLVLDEAQRLWPECWQRYAKPARINWLMTMVNAKVPILLISTPQFLTGQRVAEKTGWNSKQFTGRILNQKILPDKLSVADLMAVCRFMLPECGDEILTVLANYALISDRYLAAIEAVAMRARYLAGRADRDQCTAKDIHRALKENIIPSDSLLNKTLEQSRLESSRHKLSPAEISAEPSPEIPSLARRAIEPATADENFKSEINLNNPSRAIRPDGKESHV